MIVDAGIEGHKLPHEDNIKKVPINGNVGEFLIAEAKYRGVEKKPIVSLMDCVEYSKKDEGLMVLDNFVATINKGSLIVEDGKHRGEVHLLKAVWIENLDQKVTSKDDPTEFGVQCLDEMFTKYGK